MPAFSMKHTTYKREEQFTSLPKCFHHKNIILQFTRQHRIFLSKTWHTFLYHSAVLREALVPTVYCPNETSSTSEQILILKPKEEEEINLDPKH